MIQKLVKKKNSIMKIINALNEKSNNETIKTNKIKYLQLTNQIYQKLIDVMNKIIRKMIENYIHIIERKILRKSNERNLNENENTEFTFKTESIVTFKKVNRKVLFSYNVLLDSLNTPNFSKNLDDFINLLNDLYINS